MEFGDYDGKYIPVKSSLGSFRDQHKGKFESMMINTSHAVMKLLNTVADDLENNPLGLGEDYYVIAAIREALDNIYGFDTEKFFDITLTNLDAPRPTVGVSVKSELAQRELMFKLEEKLEKELSEPSRRRNG